MSTGSELGAVPAAIGAIFLSLFLIGCLYNNLVTNLLQKKRADGFMGIIIAFLCLITLLGGRAVAEFAAWDSLAIYTAAFLCTGAPMIAGSLTRYWGQVDNQLAEMGGKK